MGILLGLFGKQYETVGERVQALRRSLALTRRDFSKKHNIPEPTLRVLEGAESVISKKQLHKLIKAFESEGVICSEEWILKGQGVGPSPARSVIQKEMDLIESNNVSVEPILVEIACFQKFNPSSVVMRVTDEMMAPLYKRDDYVGGIKISLPLAASAYKEPCIVELKDGTMLIRTLYPGKNKDLFNLTCLNPADPSKNPFYLDVELQGIYQIVWHRKSVKV